MTGAKPHFEPLAEDALLIRFGDRVDAKVNARVHRVARALRDAALPGVADIAPAFASLLVRFDATEWRDDSGTLPHTLLGERIRGIVTAATTAAATPDTDTADPVVIPVCYGGEFGPDLDTIAAHAGMNASDVVTRHTAGEYTVAMLGFAPGFPYLLGLDDALHAPRLAMPRTRVPAGSVAIGGAQTGIYPRELPGGWNLLGRTPMVLFDPLREPPCLLTPGQAVRFRAIDTGEFARLSAGRAR